MESLCVNDVGPTTPKSSHTGTGAPQVARASSYLGLRSTRMTESPRRNILLIKRSLLTGVEPFLPFPVFGTCRRITSKREDTKGRTLHPMHHKTQVRWRVRRAWLVCGPNLCPHLLHVLQDHVAVPIKGLHTPKKLAVVPASNEHLQQCTGTNIKERRLETDQPAKENNYHKARLCASMHFASLRGYRSGFWMLSGNTYLFPSLPARQQYPTQFTSQPRQTVAKG